MRSRSVQHKRQYEIPLKIKLLARAYHMELNIFVSHPPTKSCMEVGQARYLKMKISPAIKTLPKLKMKIRIFGE